MQDADDIEVIYGLDEAERAIGLGGTDRFVQRDAAVKAALDRYLAEIHALHAIGPGGHMPVTAEMLERADPARGGVHQRRRHRQDRRRRPPPSRGVLVINAVGANAPAVAEHAVGLMLALCRRIGDTDRHAHATKKVEPLRVMQTPPRLSLLGGKVLAIIGYGFIGRSIARIVARASGWTSWPSTRTSTRSRPSDRA